MESPHESSPGSERQEDGQQSVRKRKRKTFSCLACRQRKLRCDRAFPHCSRCHKAGASCKYETAPEAGDKAAKLPNVAHISRNRVLDPPYGSNPTADYVASSRLNYSTPILQADHRTPFENRLASIDPLIEHGDYPEKRARFEKGIKDTATYHSARTAAGEDTREVLVYGSGFKTAYFGPSSQRNAASYNPGILSMYPEFKVFLPGTSIQSSAFSQLRVDAAKIRKNAKMAKRLLPCTPPPTLFDAVPDKETCTRLIKLYWDSMANLYHIYHAPAFWDAYWSYWAEPLKRTESFACTILLMAAIVNCMDRSQPRRYRGLSSIAREEAAYWTDACELFINRQSRKHLTIASFQHRILLYLAKQASHTKTKEIWERAQALFSFAIATGLHQSTGSPAPGDLHLVGASASTTLKTTPYETEMRRRLWASIVEIEMQASLDKGVPSQRIALLADCGRPSLINDDHFDETSNSLPATETREKFLPISYLSLSGESLKLRCTLAEVCNVGIEDIAYHEILAYDDRIKYTLAELPGWVQGKDHNKAVALTANLCNSAALLELQLRQFQIMLHLPIARKLSNDSRCNFSRLSAMDAAVKIVRIHEQLSVADGRSAANSALNHLREDISRAAMTMCNNLVICRGLHSDLSALWMNEVYMNTAIHAIQLLEDKVLAVGEYYAQLWLAQAALGMVKTAVSPNDLEANVQSIAGALTTLFAKVFVAQEELSNEQTAAGALTAMATPSSTAFDAHATMQVPMADLNDTQSYVNGGMDMNWEFEGFWPFTGTEVSW